MARRWYAFPLWMATVACGCVVLSSTVAVADSVQIQGKEYLDTRDIGRQFGLAVQKGASADTLRLASKWTKIDLSADSQEARINDLHVFLSDPVAADHGRFFLSRRDVDELIRPILSPRSAHPPGAVRTIVIDAGHGGNDHGNENERLHLRESVFTLDVARRLADSLQASGFKVIMTRTTDRRVELDDRVAIAARAGADLFVSIHFNSFTQPGVSGAETYVLTPRYAASTPAIEHDGTMRVTDFPGNAYDHWNAVLGYQVHRELVDALNTEDRGLKRYRYYVLRMAPCPAVLVEAAFLSNAIEGLRVNTSAYREKIADAVAAGIKDYAAAVDHTRSNIASRKK